MFLRLVSLHGNWCIVLPLPRRMRTIVFVCLFYKQENSYSHVWTEIFWTRNKEELILIVIRIILPILVQKTMDSPRSFDCRQISKWCGLISMTWDQDDVTDLDGLAYGVIRITGSWSSGLDSFDKIFMDGLVLARRRISDKPLGTILICPGSRISDPDYDPD